MQSQLLVEDALQIAGTNGDPIKALKSLAGVVGNNDRGELIIHGSKPRETLFTINYLPVGYVFHLGGMQSVFAPELVQQIDAYLGGFDVSYGNTMGGVIDLTLKYPTGKNSGRVHIGLYDSDFAYDAKITDNISLFLGGRRSYFDLIADDILEGTLAEDDEDEKKKLSFSLFPQFYDLQAILSIVDGNSLYSVEAIVSEDSLKLFNTLTGDKDPVANGKIESSRFFSTTGFRWRYFGDGFNTNTVLYRLYTSTDLALFDADYSVDIRSRTWGVHSKTVFDNIENHKPMIGIEFENERTPLNAFAPRQPQPDDVGYILTKEEPKKIDTVFNSNFYSLYLGDIYSFSDYSLRYGVRSWYTDFQDFEAGFDPRTTLIYNGIKDTALSFGVGKYSQFPNNQSVIEGLGNPNITEFEQSVHYTVGFEHEIDNTSSIKIEPYYKTFDKLAIEDETFNYMATGEGDAYGVDLTYKKRLQNLNLMVAYTYLQANRQLNTSDSELHRFYGEIPHTLQFSSSYRFGNGWRVAGLFNYSSGSPYTEVKGTEEYEHNGQKYIAPIYGTPFGESLPYTLDLDIQVGKKWKKWNGEVEFYVELLNLTTLFRDNVNSKEYDEEWKEDGYSYGMPFLPAIHFSYRF
jgi:hypothetical protein